MRESSKAAAMFQMDDLEEELNSSNGHGLYRLRFGREIEAEYRRASQRLRKFPRAMLFLTMGLCFAFGPLYDWRLFQSSSSLNPSLRLIELIVSTSTFLAIAPTVFNVRTWLSSSLNCVAVLALWGGTTMLREFSLKGEMHYPDSLIGVVVIAVAIFGGFSWYKVTLGALLVFGFLCVQEFHLNPDLPNAARQINSFFWMASIAILGAYLNEVGHRRAWINGRSAQLLARFDALTGLANRIEFNRVFPRIFKQALREERGIAVALVDIDHFKQINDAYGHLCGDDVLAAVGKTLLTGTAKRPLDIMVRFGGEEVVIVWYDVSLEKVRLLAEAVLSEIRATRVGAPNGEVIRVTASIGVSWQIPDATSAQECMVRHADVLMYRAKSEGRDRALVAATDSKTLSPEGLPGESLRHRESSIA